MAAIDGDSGPLTELEKQWNGLKEQEKTRHTLVEQLFSTIRQYSAENDSIRAEIKNLRFHELHYVSEKERLTEQCKTLETRLQAGPFVVVLIDGDNTLFIDDFVRAGAEGGHRAAKRLQEAIQVYIKDLPGFQAHWKVVVRIHINRQGLVGAYAQSRIVSNRNIVEGFLLGFNRELPLFEFVDAGADKEAADNEIKGNLALYWTDEHCKHILLAGSADRGYVTTLRSYCAQSKLTTKLTLIESVPFPSDFKHLATWFHNASFQDIFRNTKIDTNEHISRAIPIAALQTYATATSGPAGHASQEQTTATSQQASPATTNNAPFKRIRLNRQGQRIDEQLCRWNPDTYKLLKQRSLCPRHFLTECDDSSCSKSHHGSVDEQGKFALMRIAREIPCERGTRCYERQCLSAHHCLYSRCIYGSDCKYGPEMHGIDKTVTVVR